MGDILQAASGKDEGFKHWLLILYREIPFLQLAGAMSIGQPAR